MSNTPDRSQPDLEFDSSEWRESVRERAGPVLDHWTRDNTLGAVKQRLQGVLGASALVVFVQFAIDPGGVTGTLVSVWFLLALPVGAVAGSLLFLLQNPENARNVWFEQDLVATVGLVALAVLARSSQNSPGAWTAWRLLFGSDPPVTEGTSGEARDTPFGQEEVATLRRYVWFAIAGSAAVVVLEQLLVRDALAVGAPSGTIGLSLSPAESALLAVGGAVLGALVGALLAVTEF